MMEDEDDEEDEEDDEEDDELVKYLMDGDHDIGMAMRDNIIPFAVRWYTGEAAPEDDDDDDDEDSEEEDLDDDDDESEEDFPQRGRGGRPKANAKKTGKGT